MRGFRGLGPPGAKISFEVKRASGWIANLEQGSLWGHLEKESPMFRGDPKVG